MPEVHNAADYTLASRLILTGIAFLAFRSAASRYGWGLAGLLYALVCLEITKWP